MKKGMSLFLGLLLVFSYLPLNGPLEAWAADISKDGAVTGDNGLKGTVSSDPATVTPAIREAENGLTGQTAEHEQLQDVSTTEPDGLPVPTGVTAFAMDSQVLLSWETVTGAVYYNVKRSTIPGGPYVTVAEHLPADSNQYTDTGLTNHVTYYYVISVVKDGQEGGHSAEVSAKPRVFIINDHYENYPLGDIPPGYSSLLEQSEINNLAVVNNRDIDSRKTKWYTDGDTRNVAPEIVGNPTNVLWVNDKADAGRRGSYVVDFAPVTGGITAQVDFMQPKVVGDSYVLELLDGNANKIAVNLHLNASPVPIQANTWYTVKFVADLKANTADLFINGQYYGNVKFQNPLTEISRVQGRTAGSSLVDMFIDNLIVYEQISTTPQNLQAEGANKRVELTWNAADDVDSYNVYRSDQPGGPYRLIASGVQDNRYTDTDGLENDRFYYYVVTSVNERGESDTSNEAAAYPNDLPPPAEPVRNFRAIVRDSQLTLVWDPVPGATYYKLERATSPDGPFITLADRITDTSYLDRKLWNGTRYYYRLTAGNVGGLGSSAMADAAPAAALKAPVLISAESGDGNIHLAWTSVARAEKYIISRSETNGGPYAEVARTTDASYTDANVEIGKTYYYVVTAMNGSQTSRISNQRKAIPYIAAPGAPAKVERLWAEAGNGRVSLTWQPVDGADRYHVKRSTASGGPYTTIAVTEETAYVDSNVTNGTVYHYVVSAVNAAGESADSDEIVALPARILTVDPTAPADQETVFNNIQAAVDAVPADNAERIIIHIAPGSYEEKLKITKPYVSLVGSGMDATRIVWGDYAGTPSTVGQPGHVGNTFLSQTVEVDADYFTAANLTIENSAGPRSKVAQAVALSLKSNQAAFESVRLVGYQDTLYNGLRNDGGRHYFHNSIIQGDVDFIFGEAPAVVMDNVRIVLVSQEGGGGHITAGAQRNISDPGYVFFHSHIVDDASARGTYDLGRPWKDYARVSFINTNIDSDQFLTSGWLASCAGSCKEKYFSEYNSYGPGANASARDISVNLTGEEASLTIPQILNGWDPSVPVVMPHVQYMPEVVVTDAVFDKNPVHQEDVHVLIRGYNQEVKGIRNGHTPLTPSDYEARGDVYSIKRQYLARQPEGRLHLTFEFAETEVPLTIHILDTSGSDIGRQVLAQNDGWAAYGQGTTGGANAAPSQVYVVENRKELLAALGGASNHVPKIIYIKGTIDMNVDDDNHPVGIDYYRDPGYDFEAYLQAYDPAVWGRDRLPSGPLEEARAASQKKQGERIRIPVGSNTTIVGMPGTNATIRGGNLVLENVSNVIIRNIRFENTFDYFPQWDPTDGEYGNWNAQYDSISIKNSTRVWIDHNTFTDGDRQGYETYFGRKYQMYDGFLDITNGSDLVTVSYNVFDNHDKVTLVGGSDSHTADAGKLRVTFHHNVYKNVGQRAPRVRYGQVHVYNNYYEGSYAANDPYLYAIGVGYQSQVYAENNYFVMDPETPVSALIQILNGDRFTDEGTVLNGVRVRISDVHGSLRPVEWKPVLYHHLDDTDDVPGIVLAQAGADGAVPGDTRAPMWLENAELSVSDIGPNRVTLTWQPAYDNIGVAGYGIYRLTGGKAHLLAELAPGVTTFTVTNLAPNTVYSFVVQAVDAAGNWSQNGPAATVRTASGGSGGSGGAVLPSPVPEEPASDGPREEAPLNAEAPVSLNKALQMTVTDSTVIATLDADKLSRLMAETADDATTFALDVESGGAGVQVKLTGQALGLIAQRHADSVIRIETDLGSFYLPVNLLDLRQLARETGVSVDELAIAISIRPADDGLAEAFADAVRGQGAIPLTAPVAFTLTAETERGGPREFQSFNTYVARAIRLDGEVTPFKTVGVRYDPLSGKLSPVPTRFNGTEAVMLRPGNGLYGVVEHRKDFTDLAGHWAARDVELMANKLLVRGITHDRFAPDRKMTRAEFAALLVRALGLDERASAAFRDVAAEDWFSGAAGAAFEAGLVLGFADGSFRPSEWITREQMAAMITRALALAGYDKAADVSVLARYADHRAVSPWASAAMAQAVDAGIVTGTPATALSPRTFATRAEAAVMIKRMMEVLNFIQS